MKVNKLLNILKKSIQSFSLLSVLLATVTSCTSSASETSTTEDNTTVLTGEELSYNILNSTNWHTYPFDKQTVIFYYCGDTTEIIDYSQVNTVRSYMASNTSIDYYEFFTDELSALAPINDSMFFDLSAYLVQDGYLLLKNGMSMQVALHSPTEIITQHFDTFFQP
jgi:hypothetical protein